MREETAVEIHLKVYFPSRRGVIAFFELRSFAFLAFFSSANVDSLVPELPRKCVKRAKRANFTTRESTINRHTRGADPNPSDRRLRLIEHLSRGKVINYGTVFRVNRSDMCDLTFATSCGIEQRMRFILEWFHRFHSNEITTT